MYKTAYVCDCCGKEMEVPGYTLELRANSFNFYAQDRTSWHYCEDCWENVKKALTKENEPNILKKTIEDLKKENEELKKDIRPYENLFNLVLKAFAEGLYGKNWAEIEDFSKCCSDQKSNPFTSECGCCETIKNSLDYKQTVASYSSLR